MTGQRRLVDDPGVDGTVAAVRPRDGGSAVAIRRDDRDAGQPAVAALNLAIFASGCASALASKDG